MKGDKYLISELMNRHFGKLKEQVEHSPAQPKDIILVDLDALEEIRRLKQDNEELRRRLKDNLR